MNTFLTFLYTTYAPLLKEEYNGVLSHILSHVVQERKTSFLIGSYVLTHAEQDAIITIFDAYVHQQKPLAYSFGEVPFLDFMLSIEPPLLIPRPETEEWVLQLIESMRPYEHEPLHVADVGTGSGCIALALARAFPRWTVYALDINPQALACAQKNAERYHVQNIHYRESDLLSALSLPLDMVVSNPPYISTAEYDNLDLSVKAWEDKRALVADDDGYGLLNTLIQQVLQKRITTHAAIPALVLEVGHQQAAQVRQKHLHLFNNIVIKKDFCGKERVLYFYSS